MGPSCPKCGSLLDQDFGVVTCPQCSTVVSIDMDGNVQVAGEPSIPPMDFNETPQFVEANAEEQESPLQEVKSEEPEAPTLADAIAEVVEYGNQELSTSPLSYDLLIENIDDPETREQIGEILSDSRLNLNSKELVQGIIGGRLEIKNLNPVKASVIATKIQAFPLKISWSQHVYS